jgi:cyanobactin maturation PatA/PatG family protease
MLDGPVDTSHRCFAGATLQTLALKGHPPIACRTKSQGSCSHGTQIASLIFAQHGCGPVRGIAPRCRGLIIPIFRDNPFVAGGILPTSQSELARAIDLARDRGANIINISAGQKSVNGSADAQLAAAVRRCADSGVLIVSSAGNDGCDCLHVPAALPDVLVVGALDASGKPAEFSNYGYLYRAQGVLVSGENLRTADNGGGFAIRSGTSFAAPLVAGIVALLLTLQDKTSGNRGGKLNALRAGSLLLKSARSCGVGDPAVCRRFLAGTVDLDRALALLSGGEPQMTTPNPLVRTPQDRSQPDNMAPHPAGVPDPANPADNGTEIREEPGQPRSARLGRPAEPSTSGMPSPARTPGLTAEGPPQVVASDCKCGNGGNGKCTCKSGGGGEPERLPLVYALGTLGYDFGTQARFDGIAAEITPGEGVPGPVGPIPASVDTNSLLRYLSANPYAAESIIWTLNLEATPIYAIRPDGPFAAVAYDRLRQFLNDQVDPKQRAERVSIPGYMVGSQTLFSGQKVGVLVPEIRGMFNWTLKALVDKVAGKDPGEKGTKAEREEFHRKRDGIVNFLQRVYYEVRNLGLEPRDRALNFAATNAFAIERLFAQAAGAGLQLDQIDVERSPVCRLDSDCWDVILYFFNPANVLGEARHAYRFTIDVSDVIPVLIGDIREWSVR